MLKVAIGPGSAAPARAVPVAEGAPVSDGAISDAARADGFTGAAGQVCDLLAGPRTLLVGVGPAPDPGALQRAGATAAARLSAVPRIALDATGLPPGHATAFAAGACLRAWNHGLYRTRDDDAPRLEAVDLVGDDAVRAAWDTLSPGLRGAEFARALVAEPSNILTPKAFARRLRKLRHHGIAVRELRRRDLEDAGMGVLLAVGRGSAHPPRLVELRWPGTMDLPPVAFVGKGITFDTGGICIKPADGMEEMRADMAGAAACAGAMLAIALRKSPAPAVAVLAIAENMTGAASYRPGDVLRGHSGRTIEVIDTDAEGRLVLSDALSWTIAQHRPRAILDLATLTGSIVVALGNEHAGLFDSDPALAASVAAAGAAVQEPVWRMPIGDGHRKSIDSIIADLRNCVPGRGNPDACQAAAFLREFVGDTPWVHLDIAGMESRADATDAHAAGPTGFGARLLDRLVALRFEDPDRP